MTIVRCIKVLCAISLRMPAHLCVTANLPDARNHYFRKYVLSLRSEIEDDLWN